MKAILRKHSHFLIILAVLAAVSASFIYYKIAFAAISSVVFEPTTLGTDDVVGTVYPDYTVSYSTNSTGAVNTITATFQSEYSVNPSDIHFMPANIVESCNGTSGSVCINGNDVAVALGQSSGQSLIITLDAPFDYSTNAGDDTVSFKIVNYFTNPITIGAKSASEFTIEDDSTGNGPVSPVSDVIIIPGPADHFVFTTAPSDSRAAHGDFISGTVFEVAPVVTAYDSFGNIATGYNSSVTLSLASGNGTLSGNSEINFWSCPSVGIKKNMVNGVGDFSTNDVKYDAAEDHESFSLQITDPCTAPPSSLTSSAFTADVVADALYWTQDPAGCVSNQFCSIRGSVEAQSNSVVDIDYAENITFGSTGTGNTFGDTIQSMIAGVLNLTHLGYIPTHPSTPETMQFTADSGLLTQGLTGDILVGATTSGGSSGGGINPDPSGLPDSCSTNPNSELCPPGTPIDGNIITTSPAAPGSGTILDKVISGIVKIVCSHKDLRFCPLDAPTSGVSANPLQAPAYGNVLSNGNSFFSRNLTVGKSGSDVYSLQQFLYSGGFLRIAPTGYFGPATKDAVSSFQKSRAIFPSSGLVGPLTISKINSIMGILSVIGN